VVGDIIKEKCLCGMTNLLEDKRENMMYDESSLKIE
jgi:hypothetical protein